MPRPKKPEPLKEPKEPKDFFACPRGHSIPNDRGCTNLRCATDVERMTRVNAARNATLEGKELVARAAAGDTKPLEDHQRQAKDEAQFSYSEARRKFRHDKLQTPTGLTGQAADKWAEAEIQNLQVEAVAEQKWRLMYGTDEQRDSASRLFLSAGGHGPRDAREGAASSIIIINAGQMPWKQGPPIGSLTVEALPALKEKV